MDRTRKFKVALSQRIIPHYRVPVFTELSKREGIDLTVFYGKGFSSGSQANAAKIEGFKHERLTTVFINIQHGTLLRVLHPTIFYHLVLGRYDAVIVEPTTNFYNDLCIFSYCKLFRKKFIWYDAGTEPKNKRTKFRRMIDPFVSFMIRRADAFITYTSYADNSLINYYDVKPEKIFRAQNTVDTSDYEAVIAGFSGQVNNLRTMLGLDGYKVALYIGGIEKRKKINNLITANANLNHIGVKTKTLIVGDGADIEWVKENMSDFEGENTVFAGKHITDAVLYILLADVIVLPSQGGLSVTQAFACGKPFVGSEEIEQGGIKDYVTDGYNGYLVKENDLKDLESALARIFTDNKKYDMLVQGAWETSRRITVSGMVDGIVGAIHYALNA